MDTDQILSLADEYDMLPDGGVMLCAISGGADSMCLLHLMRELGARRGFTVQAAHFNHHLRGEESDRDAAFVQGWCRTHGVVCHLGECDVAAAAAAEGCGVEETARRLRYDFLMQTADRIQAQRIATAHNSDDNAETLLFHLVRGSGLQGLCGIRPRIGRIVRPFLQTSRAEIEAYLAANGLAHVEDSSNEDERYSRNFLRHSVIPLLRQLNPEASARMAQTARQLRQDNDYLTAQAEDAAARAVMQNGAVRYPAAELAALHPALSGRVIQLLCDRLGGGVLSAGHRAAVLELCGDGHSPSARLSLPFGLTARREYEALVLALGEDCGPFDPRPLPLPGQAAAGGWLITAAPAVWRGGGWDGGDFPLVCRAVTLRPRKTGDTLKLPGGRTRTLKKHLIDQKIPARLRDSIPILESDGRLAAAAGLGPDASCFPRLGSSCWRICCRRVTSESRESF